MSSKTGLACIILDLMNTIMYGEDRFGPEQDYLATYRAMGGRICDAHELNEIVAALLQSLEADYGDESRHTVKPAWWHLNRLLAREHPGIAEKTTERIALNLAFAWHETGYIDKDVAHALRRLSHSYSIVILSNLWGAPFFCERIIRKLELSECFQARLYSSEWQLKKPHTAFYRAALKEAGGEPANTMVVGDDWRLDIAPAKELGMESIWLDRGRNLDGSDQLVLQDLPAVADYLCPPSTHS